MTERRKKEENQPRFTELKVYSLWLNVVKTNSHCEHLSRDLCFTEHYPCALY